jgi:hypothetical protein
MDLQFKSYGFLKNLVHLGVCYQPLAMQQNLPKNYQNLPKSGQRQLVGELLITTKIEILMRFKN